MPKGTSFEEALRNAGLRVTRQRLAVLENLAGRDELVTAQDLHHELRSKGTRLALATIYRTLGALAEAGEVDTFPVEGQQGFRRCGIDHHHHLVCEGCGNVQEIASEEFETWVTRVARRRGFTVKGHTADIFGLCRSCG